MLDAEGRNYCLGNVPAVVSLLSVLMILKTHDTRNIINMYCYFFLEKNTQLCVSTSKQ